MACMLTGCAGLKPDEMVKTDIPDTAISTSTDIPEGWENQEEGVPQQEENENKKGFFDVWTTIYYAGRAACVIVAVGIITVVICKRAANTNEKRVIYPIKLRLNSDMPDNELINGLNNLDGIKDNLSATPIDSEPINFSIESDNADPINCKFRATKYTEKKFRLFISIATAIKRKKKRIGLIDDGRVKKGEGESITTFYLLTKLGENPRITLKPYNEFIRNLIQIVL